MWERQRGSASPEDRPNILLIVTDQQRFDAAGNAGPSFLRTPHFDQLQREGVNFASAYAQCPICVPSRTSILTGKSVFAHGMNDNGLTSRAAGREGTLPSCMKELGYQTAAIGWMRHGPQRVRHGYEEMIIEADYFREMVRSGHLPHKHGVGANELYPTMATVPESLTLTSWIAEQAVAYIRERRDPSVPFLLCCSFFAPHPPFDPPEPYYSMYRDCPIPEAVFGDWSTDDRCPEAFLRMRQSNSYDLLPAEVIRDARAAYYGLITQVDYNVGRIFGALEDVGLLHDTLIAYVSDHGEYLGDHQAGAKIFFHEPSAHVPLVVRLPQSWEQRCHGETARAPVTHADILPTLVAAAGGQPPAYIDGQDLIALACGRLASPRRYLEAKGPDNYPYAGITDGRWKYIWYPEGECQQLFDLHTDPKELNNLAAHDEFEDKRRELQQEMVRRHEERGSAFVEDGRLIGRALRGGLAADRRNRSWPGLRTEYERIRRGPH